MHAQAAERDAYFAQCADMSAALQQSERHLETVATSGTQY